MDDQVMQHARQREIARELGAPVSPLLDGETTSTTMVGRDLDRVAGQGRAAPDHGVGLVDGPSSILTAMPSVMALHGTPRVPMAPEERSPR